MVPWFLIVLLLPISLYGMDTHEQQPGWQKTFVQDALGHSGILIYTIHRFIPPTPDEMSPSPTRSPSPTTRRRANSHYAQDLSESLNKQMEGLDPDLQSIILYLIQGNKPSDYQVERLRSISNMILKKYAFHLAEKNGYIYGHSY